MKAKELIKIRERLGLNRHEMAELLSLGGYRSMMNIELESRKPNKLAIKLLRYLDSLPKQKALDFIEELNRHEPK